jgi:hypothetical protein
MGFKKGYDLGGMTSIQRLKDRCVIDSETGCWNYNGRRSPTDKSQSLWIPALQKTLSLGAAVGYLTTGKTNTPGRMWAPMCGNRFCGNPEHRKDVQAGELPRILAKHGRYDSPELSLKISRTMCKSSRWSDADIDAIRTSDKTLKELAAEYSMSLSHVSRIRQGRVRVLRGNPFAGLMPAGLFHGRTTV